MAVPVVLKLSSLVVGVLSQEWGGDLSEAEIQRMVRELTVNEIRALATVAGLVQKHSDVLATGKSETGKQCSTGGVIAHTSMLKLLQPQSSSSCAGLYVWGFVARAD